MVRRRAGSRAWGGAAALIALAILAAACDRAADPYAADPYAVVPELDRSVVLFEDGDSLRPVRLQIHRDTLWVSYLGVSRLDAYDLALERVRSIPLLDPEPVQPTAFAVTDSAIYVCDHARGAIVVYDREGAYVDSFGKLPDGATRLAPLALTHFGGVLYVADMTQRQILAVSMANAAGITEIGELILSIPGSDQPPLGLPSTVHVTPDGRLVVGDAKAGQIRVFTCDGRAIYRFDDVPDQTELSPQAIDTDRLRDPTLQDESTFDPSGLPAQGRFHVLDSLTGRVHLFNPLGRYIASYPEIGVMERPAGIAIDRGSGRVFVADPPAQRIHVFRPGGI